MAALAAAPGAGRRPTAALTRRSVQGVPAARPGDCSPCGARLLIITGCATVVAFVLPVDLHPAVLAGVAHSQWPCCWAGHGAFPPARVTGPRYNSASAISSVNVMSIARAMRAMETMPGFWTTALDAAHVGPVNGAAVRKFFLRDASRAPAAANGTAQCGEHRVVGVPRRGNRHSRMVDIYDANHTTDDLPHLPASTGFCSTRSRRWCEICPSTTQPRPWRA
jgi:hypothetical protein